MIGRFVLIVHLNYYTYDEQRNSRHDRYIVDKIHGEGGALSEEGVDEIVKFIKSEKKFRDIFLEAGANNDPASPEVQEDIEDYGNPEE